MEIKEQEKLDWAKVREKLGDQKGKRYWRSLEELAETKEFTQWLDDEFPHRKSLLDVDRRGFLKFMGATMALAGLAGCRSLPREKLVPFVHEPEDRIPGLLERYASVMPFGGYGVPVVVTSSEGRPIKLDGNPKHPASNGASHSFVHAEILNFYDPDRAQSVTQNGIISTWSDFYKDLRAQLAKNGGKGRGFAILTRSTSSPTETRLLEGIRAKYPELKVFTFDTVSPAVKRYLDFDLSSAGAVLSLDADFLCSTPNTVKYAAQFSAKRDPELGENMIRLYSVESTPTLTGANADHRWTCKPSQVRAVAEHVAAKLGVGSASLPLPEGLTDKEISLIAEDLRSRNGIVLLGGHQPDGVQEIVERINGVLGAKVVFGYQISNIEELAEQMRAGAVKALFVMGDNPVYGAPADLKFGELLQNTEWSAYLGTFFNETSDLCVWGLPESHFLEAWGDEILIDGKPAIQQPLIEPLYDSQSRIEVFASLLGNPNDGLALVKQTWGSRVSTDIRWQKVLTDGFDNAVWPTAPQASSGVMLTRPTPAVPTGAFEVVFVPDPTVYDGRYANNGWMQELPKPLTKLTWDNAVHLSPSTAQSLGVRDQELVHITVGENTVEAPVFIQPGHPDNVATLHLGYGRRSGGRLLRDSGFNFAKLRTTSNMGFATAQIKRIGGNYQLATAQVHHSMEGRDIIREGSVAEYQKHPSLTEAHEHELHDFYNLTKENAEKNPDLPQWAMAIDLNYCTGCNACVSACQAENNIPTVGKLEVQRGREMHWIRVDRYYRVTDNGTRRDVKTGASELGDSMFQDTLSGPLKDEAAMHPNAVSTVFQPLTCMHCETAPCEPVCPVAATTHSAEGLNQMVYNRCVGTRYCSNNCPYKVRRFNFYNYQHGQSDQLMPFKKAVRTTDPKDGIEKVKEEPTGLGKPYGQANFQGEQDKRVLRLLNNPNVSVRSRGVMEKCTYCVQRINAARIKAKMEKRDIRDGEVVTACQEACPSKAITFGNIADPNSKISQVRKNPRNYRLLAELGTNPRTTYLGRVRNPHPQLESHA